MKTFYCFDCEHKWEVDIFACEAGAVCPKCHGEDIWDYENYKKAKKENAYYDRKEDRRLWKN